MIGLIVAGVAAVMLVRHAVKTQQRLRARAHAVQCQLNLRLIGQALRMYADRNAGAYPDSMERLRAGGELAPDTCCCPAAADAAVGAYVYAGEGLTSADEARGDIVVAIERPGSRHGFDAVGVLRVDGHVEYLADYRPLLDQFTSGVRPLTTPIASTRPAG